MDYQSENKWPAIAPIIQMILLTEKRATTNYNFGQFDVIYRNFNFH